MLRFGDGVGAGVGDGMGAVLALRVGGGVVTARPEGPEVENWFTEDA